MDSSSFCNWLRGWQPDNRRVSGPKIAKTAETPAFRALSELAGLKSSVWMNESPETSAMRIALLFGHRLDAELMAGLLARQGDVVVIVAEVDELEVLRVTCEGSVDIAIVDAQLPRALPFSVGDAMLAEGRAKGVLLLDQEFSVVRAHRVLEIPGMGYLTRCVTSQELLDGLRRLLWGLTVIGTKRQLEDTSSPGAARASLHRIDRHGVLRLSNRELQVMRLLSQGRTVADTARALGLSESTIDNHRTRLKQKLNVKRSIDITRIAIKEGIISDSWTHLDRDYG